ncbi:hypothetical protein ACFQ0M_45530 [Kitasatospora aburaviensis]
MKAGRPADLGRGFNLFWAGQTVSVVGDRVTVFVVPTLMIFVLHASALQVGIVAMAQYLGIPCSGRWPASSSTAGTSAGPCSPAT